MAVAMVVTGDDSTIQARFDSRTARQLPFILLCCAVTGIIHALGDLGWLTIAWEDALSSPVHWHEVLWFHGALIAGFSLCAAVLWYRPLSPRLAPLAICGIVAILVVNALLHAQFIPGSQRIIIVVVAVALSVLLLAPRYFFGLLAAVLVAGAWIESSRAAPGQDLSGVLVFAVLAVVCVIVYRARRAYATEFEQLRDRESSARARLERSLEELTAEMDSRAAAEKSLKESEARYRLIADNAGDVIYVVDRDGRFTFVSPSLERVLGIPVEDRVGRTIDDIGLDADTLARLKPALAQVMDGVEPDAIMEVKQRTRDGDEIWMELHGRPMTTRDSLPDTVLVIARDISERRAATQALRRSEEHYRFVSENIADAVFVYDNNGDCIYVSPSVTRLTGHTPEEILGLNFKDLFIDSQSMAQESRLFEEARKSAISEYVTDIRHRNADGAYIWTEANHRVIRDDDGSLVAVHVTQRDITDYKEAVQALEASELRYRGLVENSLDPIFTVDRSGHIVYANPAAESQWGLPVDAMLGNHYHLGMDEQCKEAADHAFEQILSGETRAITLETLHHSLDGGEIWSEISAWPVFDERQKVTGFQCLARDITERKALLTQVEQQRVQIADRARQLTQVNEQLEGFASTVSHDLQSPLRHIRQRLARVPPADPSVAEELREVEEEAGRMSDFVDYLLDLSSVYAAPLCREPVDMGELFAELVDMTAATFGREVKSIGPEPGEAVDNVDRQLVRAILQNLIENAIKYVPDSQHLVIELHAQHSGARLCYTLRDNGPGFAQYNLPQGKPLQPVRFASVQPGHGIGLATVTTMVEKHGGQVAFENAEDGGAKIRFSLG